MTDLGEVSTTVAIVDDRVAMNADGDATLYLDTPDHRPLSARERHATIRVKGDGYRAEVTLDAEDLDALADALYHAQEGDEA